jgi:hypothetical protein
MGEDPFMLADYQGGAYRSGPVSMVMKEKRGTVTFTEYGNHYAWLVGDELVVASSTMLSDEQFDAIRRAMHGSPLPSYVQRQALPTLASAFRESQAMVAALRTAITVSSVSPQLAQPKTLAETKSQYDVPLPQFASWRARIERTASFRFVPPQGLPRGSVVQRFGCYPGGVYCFIDYRLPNGKAEFRLAHYERGTYRGGPVTMFMKNKYEIVTVTLPGSRCRTCYEFTLWRVGDELVVASSSTLSDKQLDAIRRAMHGVPLPAH